MESLGSFVSHDTVCSVKPVDREDLRDGGRIQGKPMNRGVEEWTCKVISYLLLPLGGWCLCLPYFAALCLGAHTWKSLLDWRMEATRFL